MPQKKIQSKYRTPSATSIASGSLLESISTEYNTKEESMIGEASVAPYHQATNGRDGRQIWLYISAAGIAIGLLVTTSIYASEAGFSGGMRFVYSSSSNTIFVLSVLSGITGLLITATIEGSIERLQWLLLVRGDGLNLAKFLSLHAGTGPMGLLTLLFGRGFPVFSSTRAWSAVRLISMVLVPILGILIMSDVNTKMSFHPIRNSQHVMGWGMSPFNGSLAQNVSVITDQLINAVMFLSDPTRSVDDTPGSLAGVPCANGPRKEVDTRCRRTYYLPAGVEHVAAQLDGNPMAAKSDVFLAIGQQGYVLEYEEGERDWVFDEAAECISYGFAFSGFRLCMRNTESNALQARILQCPSEVCANMSCLTNTAWHSNPGWQTSLKASFRNANVAYSRANGTVLSHDFARSKITPARTPAREMLTALHDALGDFSEMSMSSLLAILMDPAQMKIFPFYVYPTYIWGHLNSAATLASQDPAQVYRGAETLQSLLATILYF
ncbi:hypothetical protein EJ08DRAFT_136752 [Tothia fuscella]|uniref:Uncharacterized protein n=1 Tax=Tothia fuscella TaxID=1048955 RepID=A0A9P4NVI2_9PEZI|nr:hypothetical protein EJ08DRAFT_136752 [Tothia fuscella]